MVYVITLFAHLRGLFYLFPFKFPAGVFFLVVGQSICPFLVNFAKLPCGFLRPVVDAGVLRDLRSPIGLLRPRVAKIGFKRLLFWHVEDLIDQSLNAAHL